MNLRHGTDMVMQSTLCGTATRKAQVGSSSGTSEEQDINHRCIERSASLSSDWRWLSDSC